MLMTSCFVCVTLNLGRKKSTGMDPKVLYKNKTNHPIPSNIHPSTNAIKAIHRFKIGRGGTKTNGNII